MSYDSKKKKPYCVLQFFFTSLPLESLMTNIGDQTVMTWTMLLRPLTC